MIDGALQNGVGGSNDDPGGYHAVKDHAEEVLVVVEANAVSHPRTVMIHL